MAASTENLNKICFAVTSAIGHLLKGQELFDDTVIHSLLDSIKLNVDRVVSIERVGLHTFIEDVAKNSENLDSSIVVFGLQIAGWLGGIEVYYGQFWKSIQQVFTVLWRKIETKAITNISVLTALYEGLTSLTRHDQSLQWIVSDTGMEGIAMEGLVILKTSSSIFLEKAIIEYISSAMIELGKVDGLAGDGGNVSFHSRVLQTTLENIENHYSPGSLVLAPLQLLDKLCTQSNMIVRLLLTRHAVFCGYIIHLVVQSECRNLDAVLNIIGAILHTNFTNGVEMDQFTTDIGDLLSKLCTEGKIVKAQKLALCCSKSSRNEKLQERSTCLLSHWLLDEDTMSHVERCLIPEQVLLDTMSTRSKYSDIVCRSLDGNVVGVDAVVTLLRRTVLYAENGSDSRYASYLYRNRKIQRKCLEILCKGWKHDADIDGNCSIPYRAQPVVELFKETDNGNVIYSLCSQLLLQWLPVLFTSKDPVTFSTVLAQTIQFHLSALQWELRDTTLEFLANIIREYRENVSIMSWLEKHRLHVQIWQCVSDGESYVRASAISCLYEVSTCARLWSSLLESGLVTDEVDVLKIITDIVETDTEAFARRSAVTFLFKYFKANTSTEIKVRSDVIPDTVIATIVKATRDFDWEVKLTALDLVNFILQQQSPPCSKAGAVFSGVPEYTKELCKIGSSDDDQIEIFNNLVDNLSTKGLASVLFDSLDDYDEKVYEKAYTVFCNVQSHLWAVISSCDVWLCRNGYNKSVCDENEQKTTENETESLEENVPKKRKLDYVDMTRDTTVKQECARNSVRQEIPSGKSEHTITLTKLLHFRRNHGNGKHGSIVSGDESNDTESAIESETVIKKNVDVLCKILEFDPSVYEAKIELVHDSTVKLLSLVEDILSTSSKTDEENAVDCY